MSEVKMLYRNWRGEVARRSFTPVNMFHGTNEYHPVADWLIEGMDNDKNEVRTFALRGFDMTNEVALRDAMVSDRNAIIGELVGALRGLLSRTEKLLVEVDEEYMNRSIEELHAEGAVPEELTAAFSALTKAKVITS